MVRYMEPVLMLHNYGSLNLRSVSGISLDISLFSVPPLLFFHFHLFLPSVITRMFLTAIFVNEYHRAKR